MPQPRAAQPLSVFAAGINMPAGKVELKSAGALAMGPDGILFVGDSVGGAIVALDVDDRTPSKSGASSRNQRHQ